MKEDLVSVIIPLYNNDKYIEKCINSVLNQKYENVEIIVVDDGSTDNGKNIVEKIKNEKIVLISQTNSGPSVARNTGIEKSSGNWIIFLDSDDTLRENSIQILMNEIIKNQDLDMVIGGWEGQYANKNIYYGPISENILLEEDIELLGNYLLSSCAKQVNDKINMKSIEGPVAKLYSNKLIKDKNIRFPNNLRYAEDVCFNYHYLQHCKKIKSINQIVYSASRHDDSLSNSYKTFMHLSTNFEKNINTSNIKKWNIKDNIIYRYIYWTLNDLEKSASKGYKEFSDTYKKAKKLDFSVANKTYLSKFKLIELSALKVNKALSYGLFKIFNFIKSIKKVINNGK